MQQNTSVQNEVYFKALASAFLLDKDMHTYTYTYTHKRKRGENWLWCLQVDAVLRQIEKGYGGEAGEQSAKARHVTLSFTAFRAILVRIHVEWLLMRAHVLFCESELKRMTERHVYMCCCLCTVNMILGAKVRLRTTWRHTPSRHFSYIGFHSDH
jgi:hypothetical protein